jgi:hypothetical protein|tara:strand:- start:52 stop:294 length:243 start_codon:yes stop_codon:yes gene_type:complete
MQKILFKWQLGKEYKIFNTEEELIRELRKEENECSDEFIVNLSHELGEWTYVDLIINDSNNEAKEDITNFETLTLNKWID